MATYQEEKLADNPVFYARLDTLDPAETVITDISGFGNHGTYYMDNVRGMASPIETDASSRAIGGHVGFTRIENESLGNFTWEGWIYYPGGDASGTLICRGGQIGLNGSNFLAINTGNAHARISITGSGTFDLTSALGSTIGYHHLAVVRNGNVLQLYDMAVLVGEEDAAGLGDLGGFGVPFDGTNPNGYTFLGTGSSADVFASPGSDEIAIYDYPLTQTRLQAHVDAALNILSLTGVSNVLSSAVLYSDLEPDPVSFPFRHNWSDSLIERISFRAARSNSVKGYESANSLRPKPRRELELQQVLRDDAERSAFRAKLNANQHRKWFIPILEDREQLTAPLSAGSTLLPATTQYRDYEVGSYAELRQLSVTGEITKSEQVLVTSLSPFTTNPTTLNYDAYLSSISPARRGIVEAQISPRGHTGTVEDMSLVIRLLAEDEEVTPNRITPWTPTLTYKSYEVLDPAVWQSNDWTELRDYNVERERSDIDFDTGTFTVESDTIGASESFGYRMTLEGRDKHAALLGWFYARAGSINYLWVPTMQADFIPVSAVSDDLTVRGHNYFDNYAGSEYRRDLAFVYFDNTMEFRRIEGVTLDGANEVLDLNTSAPTFTNLRTVSYLRFCRLDGDTLEIARVTDTKAQFAWGFREILSSPI